MTCSQCAAHSGACNRCNAQIKCVASWLSRYQEGCISTLPRLNNGSAGENCCTGSGIVYRSLCSR